MNPQFTDNHSDFRRVRRSLWRDRYLWWQRLGQNFHNFNNLNIFCLWFCCRLSFFLQARASRKTQLQRVIWPFNHSATKKRGGGAGEGRGGGKGGISFSMSLWLVDHSSEFWKKPPSDFHMGFDLANARESTCAEATEWNWALLSVTIWVTCCHCIS